MRQMRSPNADRAGIMVAFNPQPVTPGLKPREPHRVIPGQGIYSVRIVKTVAKAQDATGACRLDISLKPQKGVAHLIGGKLRAAAARDAIRLAKV